MNAGLIAAVISLALVGAGRPLTAALGQAPSPAPAQQNRERVDLPNPYRTVADIVTMPDGRKMGSTNAINVDGKGNIWVFER